MEVFPPPPGHWPSDCTPAEQVGFWSVSAGSVPAFPQERSHLIWQGPGLEGALAQPLYSDELRLFLALGSVKIFFWLAGTHFLTRDRTLAMAVKAEGPNH